MRTREAVGSMAIEARPGTDCMARYAGTKSRPNGALLIWGDIRCAAGAVQVLNSGSDLNMFDRHIEISAQLSNPVPPDYDKCLPGEGWDYLIYPAPFAGPTGAEDRKLYCIGSLYTANGWDKGSPRGPSGAMQFNYAQFWWNLDTTVQNAYIYVGPTGALEFYNNYGSALNGTYKIWVLEQTGKRYAVP